jgi:hypothetical protein
MGIKSAVALLPVRSALPAKLALSVRPLGSTEVTEIVQLATPGTVLGTSVHTPLFDKISVCTPELTVIGERTLGSIGITLSGAVTVMVAAVVRSENTEVPNIRETMVATTMNSLFVALFALLASSFRTRAALQAEILALRHQLAVFQKNSPRRLRLHCCDRLLWVVLYRFWSGWRGCLQMVQPDTVLRWHRRAFAWHWTRKSRRLPGRPEVAANIRDLIRLSIPKMPSGANAFEISDIQEERNREPS